MVLINHLKIFFIEKNHKYLLLSSKLEMLCIIEGRNSAFSRVMFYQNQHMHGIISIVLLIFFLESVEAS